MMTNPVTVDRFMHHVDIDASGCWLWTGCLYSNGYAQLPVEGRRGQTQLGHRVAYELFVGPIPDGLTIDHLCRVRHCVNPEHLEPVTNAENNRRGFSPSAINARKTHCAHGHEFTRENTRIRVDGARKCRICDRLEKQRWERLGRRVRGRSGLREASLTSPPVSASGSSLPGRPHL